jgi:hypothetical protein
VHKEPQVNKALKGLKELKEDLQVLKEPQVLRVHKEVRVLKVV